uniref:D-isomer specific 2-hydroxyacid dehydrogenase catalytic domain-containing protein n=1 Tax=Meloidogyne incognita TaxID=6306 RepID=A0A914KYL3_MELIC
MRRVVVSSVSNMMSLNSTKPKILMTDSTFNLTKLKEIGDVIQHDSPGQMPRTLLEEKIVDVDALFCLVRDKIDSQILEKAKNLKMIGTMSVGYEHINLEECKRRGIRVGYTPDVLTETVAELGMALILATARRLPEAINSVKSGGWRTWSPYYMCGKSLANSVVGIYGLGKIGTSIANKIQPFMPEKIIYNNRKKKEE